MSEVKTIQADNKGNYALEAISRADVDRMDIVDIDLVITTKAGDRIVLVGAGLAAMGDAPPNVEFSDAPVPIDQLFNQIGVASSVDLAIQIPSTIEAQAEAEKEKDEEKKDDESEKSSEQTNPINENTETSIEKLVEQAEEIEENLHKGDYDYVPPHQYQPPSAPFSAAPGVPPPISLTPIVSLAIGNVVGTTISGSDIYGGGGGLGTSASDSIGPRDAGQFSAAVITGTAGDDVIYANGPLVGNANPSVSRANNAKEFLLSVAGYFTTLNDIVITGVPDEASITGATDNGGGSWTLPSSYVIDNEAFTIVYDMDAARALTDKVFDLDVTVSGNSTRGITFSTTQSFRFQYMDVTSVNQITDPTLVYVDGGLSKQIYVLPTLAQPSVINAGDGNDQIFGGINKDTITAGSGNNTINADAGDDIVTTGNGNNTINLGTGNNTLTAGSGNDTITASTGNNTINAGAGTNSVTVGNGNSTITSGSGDDTITVGDGNNTVNAGDGTNSITTGNGNNIISAGSGNDTLIAGNGTNTLKAGLGTNALTGGSGITTADYTDITTTAISVTLQAAGTSTVTGTGLTDTLTNIQNITGTTLADTIVGSTLNNILSGGAGNDILTGGGGNDTYYGGEGDDTITGNTGDDIIYAGNGNNTVYTGTAGADFIYGGTGTNTFISQHAGVTYNGTNSANFTGGAVNTIDYSADNTGMNINLGSGTATGGLAQGDIYAFTPTSGQNSINGIIGGSGNDVITGSAANDVINGGGGNDDLRGGLGNNILTGGSGTNSYFAGLGNDQFIGSTAHWDELWYFDSSRGVVINLDVVDRTFVNSLGATITVSALSGTNRQENAADVNAFSNGDTFTTVSGNNTGIDQIWGSGSGSNIVFSGATSTRFYGRNFADKFFGGSGADDWVGYSSGADRADGGGGASDVFYTWALGRSVNVTVHLDGSLDFNNNGIADYLDKGLSLSTLTDEGITYSGFSFGYNNETSYVANSTTLLKNFENILGNTGNDTLVGDNNANLINGRTGTNALYGMGGDDIIYGSQGANAIDGGSGTDTVNFVGNAWNNTATVTTSVQVFLADATFTGGSDKTANWGAGFSGFQARTGSSGTFQYSTITNVENVTGSDFNDVLYGNNSANTINGGDGNDIIAGNGGADTLNGGAGNDTFRIASADLATVTLISGSTGTDTVVSAGYSLSSGSITGAKFSSIEVLDIRNGAGANSYTINANDITGLADNGTSSSVNVRIDTGDTLTITTGAGTGALSFLTASSNATNTVYWLYSDAAHAVLNTTNRVAILDVYTGAG